MFLKPELTALILKNNNPNFLEVTDIALPVIHAFFTSKAFFQLSLIVAKRFHGLSFKCCLGVALQIAASSN